MKALRQTQTLQLSVLFTIKLLNAEGMAGRSSTANRSSIYLMPQIYQLKMNLQPLILR